MGCIDLRETDEERDRRIDCLLREMVVREGLCCVDEGRTPRLFSLEEIGDFVGLHWESVRRLEARALRKMKETMLT